MKAQKVYRILKIVGFETFNAIVTANSQDEAIDKVTKRIKEYYRDSSITLNEIYDCVTEFFSIRHYKRIRSINNYKTYSSINFYPAQLNRMYVEHQLSSENIIRPKLLMV